MTKSFGGVYVHDRSTGKVEPLPESPKQEDWLAFLPTLPVPTPNNLDWQVGIKVTLPLFEGGARSARVRQSEQELAQTKTQRHATERLLEQRVRTALHRAGASLPAIDMAQDSHRAAEETLDITEDAYTQGVATLVQMLDAQNQATVTQLAASNAVYDHLIDIINVERAIGRFGFFEDQASTQRFFKTFEVFKRRYASR